MDLFEYQGKQLFARYGIPVSPGGVADTVDEAVAAADAAGLSGRRRRRRCRWAGGARPAASSWRNDADEVRTHAGTILGLDIKGHVVGRLWVEHASDIEAEYYASFTLDRAAKLHLGMLSASGGIEIETVAEEDPDAIARIHIDPVDGLDEKTAREWVAAAKLEPAATEGAVDDPAEALPRVRRRRRRPRRDQPAHPHARRARCTRSTPR